MGQILTWFYCLPMEQVAAIMLLAAWILCRMEARWRGRRLLFAGIGLLLALWAGAVLYSTLANRESGGPYPVFLIPLHSYRELLSGGKVEILRTNFMNVVLFFPGGLLLGLLLPRKWPWWSRIVLGTVVLAAMSAGVEWVQYRWQLGRTEVDDVLHNSLGGLLGSGVAALRHHLRKDCPEVK